MEFTKDHYARIHNVLPRQRGNVAIDNFTFLCAIFYMLENGCKWRKLPNHFGNWHTIYVRFQRWAEKGVWQQINEVLLAEHLAVIDVTTLSLDSTTVKVHPDGTGAQKKRSPVHR